MGAGVMNTSRVTPRHFSSPHRAAFAYRNHRRTATASTLAPCEKSHKDNALGLNCRLVLVMCDMCRQDACVINRLQPFTYFFKGGLVPIVII